MSASLNCEFCGMWYLENPKGCPGCGELHELALERDKLEFENEKLRAERDKLKAENDMFNNFLISWWKEELEAEEALLKTVKQLKEVRGEN